MFSLLFRVFLFFWQRNCYKWMCEELFAEFWLTYLRAFEEILDVLFIVRLPDPDAAQSGRHRGFYRCEAVQYRGVPSGLIFSSRNVQRLSRIFTFVVHLQTPCVLTSHSKNIAAKNIPLVSEPTGVFFGFFLKKKYPFLQRRYSSCV